MSAHRFFRYDLRTTDVAAARAFYAGVLGAAFWGDGVAVYPLPERVAAQGAPPHWLGHVGAPDAAATAAEIVAQGGQQLGPMQRGPDGSPHALLRDPFGARLAVSAGAATLDHAPLAWHVLHAADHERAFAWYAARFGWTATEAFDLGPEGGRHQLFAWDESRHSVGGVSNGARVPHVHPQWLFFFPVADLEAALARVRAGGGIALAPTRSPDGNLFAGCDDPQGGAFGLHQAASPAGEATSRRAPGPPRRR